MAERTRLPVVALVVATFCSSAGELAQVTIVGKLVYDITHSVFDLGLVGLVAFAPAFGLVFVVGSVADGFQRRRVASFCGVAAAAIALAFGWYAGTDPTSAVPIFALVLLVGICNAFSAPSMRALPADVVHPTRLPWLVARSSLAFELGAIVGPILAGFLFVADVRFPFLAIAVLQAAGAGAVLLATSDDDEGLLTTSHDHEGLLASSDDDEGLLATSDDEEATTDGASGAFEGVRFVRGEPILLGAISLDLFAVLFGGAVALLPAIAEDRLGVGAVGLGWLRAATGVGAGLATVLIAVRPIATRVGRTLLAAVAIFGVFTVTLGLTRNFAVAFIALLALSAADAVSVFIRATLVPLVTPRDKRGRVLAVENVFIGASNELGGFESGAVAQLLGTSGSVVFGGIATLAVAVAWGVLFPALRNVDRFPGTG